MAEGGDDGQEKTEDPSQRRLEKAAEDGEILSSKEMFVFSTMAVGMGMIYALSIYVPSKIGYLKAFFKFGSLDKIDSQMLTRLGDGLWIFIVVSAIIGAPMLVAVLATQGAVGGGINFTGKALMVKGNRINPLAGLKRMFSMKALVELGKAIAKVSLLGAAFVGAIWFYLPTLLHLTETSLIDAFNEIFWAVMMALGASLIVLGAIAGLDLAYSWNAHMQKLRMSRQDMKDEYKQTEGSPEIKSRIRRLQMEASRRAAEQGAALEDVADATAVITNPTHFAIALKYVPGETRAPIILAMGRGQMAERIIAKANEHDVTIFRSPLLARALYYSGGIGQEITDGVYTAVAAVLAYIFRLDRGETPEEPWVEIPSDLQFDEHGKPMPGEE